MSLYRYYPPASDRMGTLWTLCSIRDAYIVEYGPSGNTSFAAVGLSSLNTRPSADIFTTHINENDIALGRIDDLTAAVTEVDGQYGPKNIFILASSLVAVTGTDIAGICREMQPRVNARLIPADRGGYIGDHTYGVRTTLKLLCSDVVEDVSSDRGGVTTYNIIGSQVDYYNYRSDLREMKRLIREYFGFECNAVLTAESTMNEIYQAGKADFNVVMRSEGLDAAEVLQNRFGTPHVFGRPYGVGATVDFLNAVSETAKRSYDGDRLRKEIGECKKALFELRQHIKRQRLRWMVSGGYDLVRGIKALLREMEFEDVFQIVNHKLKGKKYAGYNDAINQLKVNPSEKEIIKDISAFRPNVVLGDAALLDMTSHDECAYRYQISNPNHRQFRFYDGAPFIGFGGVKYLSEVFCNMIETDQF